MACGSGGGGGHQHAGPGDGRGVAEGGPPALQLEASPGKIAPGGSVTLVWSSSQAQSCSASGGWSGPRDTSGSISFGPIEDSTTFELHCAGAGGEVSRRATVTVGDAEPVVSLRVEPVQIPVGGSATLIWSAEYARQCQASGGWRGEQALAGTFGTGGLQETVTYTLSCESASGTVLESVTVEVLDRTLRWQAPTQNVDGTALRDLAGYVVHWGPESREYQGSYRIDDPRVTKWEADIAPGTYFFALTALDLQGNESLPSNEVEKTIP